jgi:hypothetical protein
MLHVNSSVDAGTIMKASEALAAKTQLEIANALTIVQMALLRARIKQDKNKIHALRKRKAEYIALKEKRFATISLLLELANTIEEDLMESHQKLT